RAEIWLTAALLAAVLAIGGILGFRLNLPRGDSGALVGIHYLYPLIGIAIWGALAFIGQKMHLAQTFLVALPCYAVVLICHFNLKLWAPHINPILWDSLYWQFDIALRPLVDGCLALRRAMAGVVPLDSNIYMTAFISMFYLSFCFHAVRDPHHFRTLFLAALIFQGAGGLAYLVMPALGPFIYETGVEPIQTAAQQSMLRIYHENLDGGSPWISAHGATYLTTGLAAMPSLHTGGSFLFLLFAWRYARVLTVIYVPLFGFIAINAVASRWHYLIDLPVGIALALGSAWIAERLNPRAAARRKTQDSNRKASRASAQAISNS
ncbi:MAG: phosphatase PAP2 family protein, partial [Novosphingobium sp.]